MTFFETIGTWLAKLTSFMPDLAFSAFGDWLLILPIVVGAGLGVFLAIT